MTQRRDFLKLFGLSGAAAMMGSAPLQAAVGSMRSSGQAGSGSIVIEGAEEGCAPLQQLKLRLSKPGILQYYDGQNRLVSEVSVGAEHELTTGGGPGHQLLLLFGVDGLLLDMTTFRLDAQTRIKDGSGKYERLLHVLYHSMTNGNEKESDVVSFNGKHYHHFVRWIRDHVHCLKGLKYFYPELKTGIELYTDSQREDGMIWDNYNKRPAEGDYWDQRFAYGDFVRAVDGGRQQFRRIPVENDVEYLFIEGIYWTWKAVGDDAWMTGLLDHALKALDYATNDPLRWSGKYQLLKRGYTIDTWDFQNQEDAAISTGPGKMADPMVVTGEHTRFGIMFGDNTGMAASCRYLAEMLEVADRAEEAVKVRETGERLEEQLDRHCWNGEFYRHHLPEQEDLVRDLGVDESRQVSLSNAYSLNRFPGREKAKGILATYQRLREEMPATSPGEFYTIFPPFGKGFGEHNTRWSYMNGGVTSIVAGELAHGAFEHGIEDYGVDILERLLALADRTDGYLHCTYRGAMDPAPERKFSPLSLQKIANTDTHGKATKSVAGWTGEGDNDLHEFPSGRQVFHDIPFDIIDRESNGGRVCLGLSAKKPYLDEAWLKVGKKARSVYFLHTTGKQYYAGSLLLEYEDGSSHVDHIANGKISNWWYPTAPQDRKQMPRHRIAWRGRNAHSRNVGVSLYGLNNPHPDKKIKGIRFRCAGDSAKWMVLGVTLSDYPVFFMPDPISAGIPNAWGAAAVLYALAEGLCGIYDRGRSYSEAEIAPRWAAAGEKQASVCLHYPASGGYMAYDYRLSGDPGEQVLELRFTGTHESATVRVLLPAGASPAGVLLNGSPVSSDIEQVEGSSYLLVRGIETRINHLKFTI